MERLVKNFGALRARHPWNPHQVKYATQGSGKAPHNLVRRSSEKQWRSQDSAGIGGHVDIFEWKNLDEQRNLSTSFIHSPRPNTAPRSPQKLLNGLHRSHDRFQPE